MKKLRKLHLNEEQCIQMKELEKVVAGRTTVTLSDHCTCSYVGDYHLKYCLSADVDASTILTVIGLGKTAIEIGSCFGPYGAIVGGIYGSYVGAQLINPSIDIYKMIAEKYQNGMWSHYQTHLM